MLLLLAGAINIRAETIRIGVLTDLTGSGRNFGLQTLAGAKLAEQELLARGIDVHFTFEDHGLNPQHALSAAQKLLYSDKIDAAYVDFTPTSIAVSPLFKNQRKLLLYSAAAETPLKSNPYAFKTYADYASGCEALAHEFKSRGVETIGLLKAEAEYGELCDVGVRRVYPSPFIINFKPNDDLSTQILKFREAKVGAVISGCLQPDLVRMLQAAATLNLNRPFGTSLNWYTPEIMEKYRGTLRGSLAFSLSPLPAETAKKALALVQSPDMPQHDVIGLAYVHLQQLTSALISCKKDDVDCQVANLERSPADARIGFSGWVNRRANLTNVLSIFTDSGFQPVSTYVSKYQIK